MKVPGKFLDLSDWLGADNQPGLREDWLTERIAVNRFQDDFDAKREWNCENDTRKSEQDSPGEETEHHQDG